MNLGLGLPQRPMTGNYPSIMTMLPPGTVLENILPGRFDTMGVLYRCRDDGMVGGCAGCCAACTLWPWHARCPRCLCGSRLRAPCPAAAQSPRLTAGRGA